MNPEMLVRSYRFLRIAMVGVLVCLAVAVALQTRAQDKLLDSISAYYYTPAQGVFVAALLALGVCMIALEGTRPEEDVLLNVGGMFAPVVAFVPTARSEDTQAVLTACEEVGEVVLGDQGVPVDCDAAKEVLRAYAEATAGLNIENNMSALLVAGCLGLLATPLFHLTDPHPMPRRQFWGNFAVAATIFAIGAFVFLGFPEVFADKAHGVAAFGLFGCIILVAIVNAVRHYNEKSETPGKSPRIWRALRHGDRYALVALAMLAVLVILGAAAYYKWFPSALFALEAALVFLFAAFWTIQTIEQWHQDKPRDYLKQDSHAEREGSEQDH